MTKEVGVIGQKYEDRKTGRCGVLVDRDDKYKTLEFEGDDGNHFKISNSTFRSSWRKVKGLSEDINANNDAEKQAEEPVKENEPEVEETTPEAEETDNTEDVVSPHNEPKEDMTFDEAITDFISSIMQTRLVGVKNNADNIEILVDEVIVIRINNIQDDIFNLQMLPDVFTFSNWKRVLNALTLQFNLKDKDRLCVYVNTNKTSIPEILSCIEDAVRDINLYGYIREDSEE